jgi:hypothetical protein
MTMTRLELCRKANEDEMARFNAAVRSRSLFIDSPDSLHHGHKVISMRSDFWLVTEWGGLTQTWAYCNDGRWAKLLAAAGVERNPLYRKS